jgi:hypothetical protein
MIDYVINNWQWVLEVYITGAFIWVFFLALSGQTSIRLILREMLLWPISLVVTMGTLVRLIFRGQQ